MATKVHMEALSPTMEEGQIVKWLKSEGDEVASGDILAEIETDKAVMELVARGDGILRKVLIAEGGTAPVGDVIAVIGAADEDISELVGASGGDEEKKEKPAATAEKPAKPEVAEKPAPGEADSPRGSESPDGDKSAAADSTSDSESPDDDGSAAGEPAPSRKEGERIKASPVARRLADEAGVNLAGVSGSGPGGRIVKKDVEAAAEAGPASGPVSDQGKAAPPRSAPASAEDYEDIRLSQMRKTIAKRLVESIGPVPHFFLTIDVDMSRAVEARERVNSILAAEGAKVSYNDIILKATAMALSRHPECNAHWGGDHIRRFNRVHLGVAVAIEDGLITPVIRDAHLKGMAAIAAEVRELAGRAREKKLAPDEYTGATFSVSNLGMFGIEEFTAVINPPEAGILAVGAMEERAFVEDGELVIGPRMKVTMSCDHRVIDGAQGSRFLQTFKAILEEPLVALM